MRFMQKCIFFFLLLYTTAAIANEDTSVTVSSPAA